jgi:hypothetical protein
MVSSELELVPSKMATTHSEPTNVKEAFELMEAGHEYVWGIDNVKLFRRRK